MELKSLVDQPGKLPTIPKVVQQLMTSFNSEEVSAQDIAHQIDGGIYIDSFVIDLTNGQPSGG